MKLPKTESPISGFIVIPAEAGISTCLKRDYRFRGNDRLDESFEHRLTFVLFYE